VFLRIISLHPRISYIYIISFGCTSLPQFPTQISTSNPSMDRAANHATYIGYRCLNSISGVGSLRTWHRPRVIEWVLYNNIPTSVACQNPCMPDKANGVRTQRIATCPSLAKLVLFELLYIREVYIKLFDVLWSWSCVLGYMEYRYLLQPRSSRYFSAAFDFRDETIMCRKIHTRQGHVK
jgi:hypothetical protein